MLYLVKNERYYCYLNFFNDTTPKKLEIRIDLPKTDVSHIAKGGIGRTIREWKKRIGVQLADYEAEQATFDFAGRAYSPNIDREPLSNVRDF